MSVASRSFTEGTDLSANVLEELKTGHDMAEILSFWDNIIIAIATAERFREFAFIVSLENHSDWYMINVLKVLWERCTCKYFKLKSNIKSFIENEIKKVSGRPCLSVHKDQYILVSKSNGCPQASFDKSKSKSPRISLWKLCNIPESSWNLLINRKTSVSITRHKKQQ